MYCHICHIVCILRANKMMMMKYNHFMAHWIVNYLTLAQKIRHPYSVVYPTKRCEHKGTVHSKLFSNLTCCTKDGKIPHNVCCSTVLHTSRTGTLFDIVSVIGLFTNTPH